MVGTDGLWDNMWLNEIKDILIKNLDDDKIDVDQAT